MEKNAFFLVRFRNARERHFKKGRETVNERERQMERWKQREGRTEGKTKRKTDIQTE
jgi:hypothetical protein